MNNTDITGRGRGGKALAAKLTPEERKAKAMAMVEAKRAKKEMLKAEYRGELKIGDIIIPCAVLSNGDRVITEHGVNSTLGTSGGKNYRLRDSQVGEDGPLPLFVASKALKPFVDATFTKEDLCPIEYLDNGKINRGYSASILPKVCEVWLKADDKKALQPSQASKVKKANILMRGLAHVGIIALIDEATGYQDNRAKDELSKILEAFVAKELQPWIKTFPISYYKELCRLYKVPFPPKKNNKFPQFFGHITNNAIYSRLAPELLPELKKEAGKLKKKATLHQLLTADVGHPKLKEHLASIVTLLKLSDSKKDFFDMVDKVHPKFNENYTLDFEDV